MKGPFTIEGMVSEVIFANPDNGYTVFALTYGEEEMTCVGYMPELHPGEHVRLSGKLANHPSYGQQMQVDSCEKRIPTTLEGIEKYLGSGVIKGVGPKLSKKIVEQFGQETFAIIESAPEKLAVIRGITAQKARNISLQFIEQSELRNIMVFFQEYGIGTLMTMKIYKKYKSAALDIVRNNPYQLADEIAGIGFRIADKIALNIGFENDAPHRIKSGVKYILNQSASNGGHLFLPKDILMQECSEILDVTGELVEEQLLALQLENQIMILSGSNEPDKIYLAYFYQAEQAVARKLLEMVEEYESSQDTHLEQEVLQVSQQLHIELAEDQKAAVLKAMTNGVAVITGGPGTGKTTTINTIIRLFEKEGLDIILAAPTGRAAKRMTEATGFEAKTIHRLLEINYLQEDARKQKFERDDENPLDADVVIIDEASMMDILLMNSLLKAIPLGARLVLVGDADQLPSVGPGNVLKDIIRCGLIPVACLTEVFRQAQQSAIVMNAHRINQGVQPVLNEKNTDFFFVSRPNLDGIAQTIVELITERLPKFMPCDPIKDIQVLTPMRKTPIGMVHLNAVLQKALNPPSLKKKEKEFKNGVIRIGDKVMQIKNNYNIKWKVYNPLGKQIEEGTGVYNGDEGIVTAIDDNTEEVRVLFSDGKIIDYDYSQLDELEHSFAITIHKSQGSEYPLVIIPVHSGPPMLMTRNLLYTAVTRGKKMVVIVGSQEMLIKMTENVREVNRYSSLDVCIQQLFDTVVRP